ncbi:polyamine aminopropyltransferase [Glycomyces albidus]|uniref:Spermidine synthase n=1 Tax=Glycomyces albidus TaxID=2656774 RepID=A0A6L5GG22_9ACTN|nr:spermidine synthase [Glycomyces albidus]MQM28648.1 spermidine synthase [Glycomyces albidus]
MSIRFEVLDSRPSPMGEISLRRRYDSEVRAEVYEVKLGEEFLMSSLFPVAEIELAHLGLARTAGTGLDVIVGGLGLGYTAQAALEDRRVATVTVVEYSAPVIDWHRRNLIPDTAGLAADPRIRLARMDFFAAAMSEAGFHPDEPDRRYDAILLDIDHTPRHVLHEPHTAFYTVEGLRAASAHLRPGGCFAMWSDDPADDEFMAVLAEVFTDVENREIWFDNPYTGGESSNSVYLATKV